MKDGVLKDLLEGRKWPTDLILVIAFTVLGAVCALLLPDGNALRVVLGIPLLLLFPGWAIVSALWPYARPKGAGSGEAESEKRGFYPLERAVLSLGLSISLVAVFGIILHFVWSITLVSLITVLSGFILFFSALACHRRSGIGQDERFFICFTPDVKSGVMAGTRVDKVVSLALGISLIVSCCALAYLIMAPPGDMFTEFYLLDGNRTIQDIPFNLTLNETGTVIVVVACHEHALAHYSVSINRLNTTGERENATLGHYDIEVGHGDINETVLDFQINETGRYMILFSLYKDESQSPYRETHIWVLVNEEQDG